MGCEQESRRDKDISRAAAGEDPSPTPGSPAAYVARGRQPSTDDVTIELVDPSYSLPPVPPTWEALEPATRTAAFRDLGAFLAEEAARGPIFPPAAQVFRALALTPLPEVRVVILGQDPYHGPGQAEGLSFSVPRGVRSPPSLRNILRELQADVGTPPPAHGSLERWARNGVLLLNTVLTVRAGEAHSHARRGWEGVTDAIVRLVAAKPTRVVFALWGGHAQRKRPLVEVGPHAVVEAAHPSPLAAHRGFLGSRPFSRIDAALKEAGQPPIDWALD